MSTQHEDNYHCLSKRHGPTNKSIYKYLFEQSQLNAVDLAEWILGTGFLVDKFKTKMIPTDRWKENESFKYFGFHLCIKYSHLLLEAAINGIHLLIWKSDKFKSLNLGNYPNISHSIISVTEWMVTGIRIWWLKQNTVTHFTWIFLGLSTVYRWITTGVEIDVITKLLKKKWWLWYCISLLNLSYF